MDFVEAFKEVIPELLVQLSQLTVSSDPQRSKRATIALFEFCNCVDIREFISHHCSAFAPFVIPSCQGPSTKVTRMNLPELSLNQQKDSETCICQIASLLCGQSCSRVLRVIADLLKNVVSLSKLLMPYILLDLSLDVSYPHPAYRKLSNEMSGYLVAWTVDSNTVNRELIKEVINCLEFLRQFKMAWDRDGWKPSTETVLLPKRWRRVYWLEIDYSIIAAASLKADLPATALFYMEEWCRQMYGVPQLPELEFTHGTGGCFEDLMIAIYSELADTDVSKVVVEEFNKKFKINRVLTTTTTGTSSANRSSVTMLPESTLFHSSKDFWKTHSQGIEEVLRSWSPICHQESTKSDLDIKLKSSIHSLEQCLLSVNEIFPECIGRIKINKECTYFLNSMSEALELLFSHPESTPFNTVLQNWKNRTRYLEQCASPGVLEEFLDLQYSLLSNLEQKEELKDLLLMKIKLQRKQRYVSSAESVIKLFDSLTEMPSSAPIDKYRGITSLVHIEEGKLSWNKGNRSLAIGFAKFMIKEIKNRCRLDSWSFDSFSKIDGVVSQQQLFDASVLCQWLCLLSKWLFNSQLEPFSSVICHMNNAEMLVKQPEFIECPDLFDLRRKFHNRFAYYADRHYISLLHLIETKEMRVNSPAFAEKQKELELIKLQLKHEDIGTNETSELELRFNQLNGPIEADIHELKELRRNRDHSVLIALEHYSHSLQMSNNNNDLRIIFRISQLWFELKDSIEINKTIKSCIRSVPSYKFLPVLDQIVSRLSLFPHDADQDSFLSILRSLVWNLCNDHPYHVLPRVIALRNGDLGVSNKQKSDRSIHRIVDLDKIKASRDLLRECEMTSDKMRRIISQMEVLIKCYIDIASISKTRDPNQSAMEFPRDIWHQTQELDLIPILSTHLPIQCSGTYEFPHFRSFDKVIKLQKGVSGAKVIEVIDSDGSKFKEVIKSGDDLHQDAILQQLFGVTNKLLQHDLECRKRKLAMQTYKVLPLSPSVGLIQWVEDTCQISEYLIGLDKKSGVHSRFCKDDELSFQECYERMRESPYWDKAQIFQEVCSKFPPLWHHFFMETNNCAIDWYKSKIVYTRSIAVSSVVGYVVGLGDRHLDNILIRRDTFDIVHIDLGVAFDQGLFLPIPEVVPFRLTREIVDGMGVFAVKGSMTKCCELTMKVLKENKDCLEMIFEVFLHDPLSTWTLTSIHSRVINLRFYFKLKTAAHFKTVQSHGSRSQHENKESENAKRITTIIKQKLQGLGDSGVLSVEGQVQKLIQDAQDPNNLCRMYCGWAPWL
eukprot:g4141.t1